jgi:hypothetical protein
VIDRKSKPRAFGVWTMVSIAVTCVTGLAAIVDCSSSSTSTSSTACGNVAISLTVAAPDLECESVLQNGTTTVRYSCPAGTAQENCAPESAGLPTCCVKYSNEITLSCTAAETDQLVSALGLDASNNYAFGWAIECADGGTVIDAGTQHMCSTGL